eukprot:g3501.t1
MGGTSRQAAELVRFYAGKRTTPFSLRELFLHGQATGPDRVRNTRFLHRELPIRLAQRIQDLRNMPAGLSHNRYVASITELYSEFFVRLTEAEKPVDEVTEEKYTNLLENVLLDKDQVVVTLARGVLELRKELGEHYTPPLANNVKDSMSRFFMARTGLQFIMEQHIAGKADQRRRGYSGVIQEKCVPADVIKAASDDAVAVCERCLGDSPSVHIVGDTDLSFTYVPHHLHYVMFELLKNALRATVENHRRAVVKHDDHDFAPVEVIIARGKQDITIKVSDKGGGIPFQNLDNVWDFMYSSANLPENGNIDVPDLGSSPVLAGYGVGLPLSRIYAKYFGGGLHIMSMEGWGTDAYVHLSRLGDRCEALPETVAMSPGELDSTYKSRAPLRSSFDEAR